jgi:hypothetical protein
VIRIGTPLTLNRRLSILRHYWVARTIGAVGSGRRAPGVATIWRRWGPRSELLGVLLLLAAAAVRAPAAAEDAKQEKATDASG